MSQRRPLHETFLDFATCFACRLTIEGISKSSAKGFGDMKKTGIAILTLESALRLWALPPSKVPLPFEIAACLPYQIYWLISITIGAVVCVRIAYLATLDRSRHLWNAVAVLGAFFSVVLCDALTELGRAGSVDDNLSRIASMAFLCLTAILVPRIVEGRPEINIGIRPARFIALMGAAMLVHYLASGAWFYIVQYDGGRAHYFDGHRVLPAFVVFVLVSLAAIYLGFAFFVSRNRLPLSERKALRLVSLVSIIFVVPMVAIDEIRFLMPSLWALYPREDCFVLPLFYACMSLAALRYSRAYAGSHRSGPNVAPLNKDSSLGFESQMRDLVRKKSFRGARPRSRPF